MTAARAHLQLMSKPRLVAIIERMAATIAASDAEAKHWRAVATGMVAAATRSADTPEAITAEAERILASLPIDPDADQHRDDLLAAIPTGGNTRQPGPRCQRCDRLLIDGLCGSHDWQKARAARSAA